ncbi:MAG: fucose isomerase, partial [Candidatus Thorarchaeota archaeon]
MHPIISDLKGGDLSYGAIQGRIKSKHCTLLRIETNDVFGEIKAIFTEGIYTDDPLDTFGGYGVVEIPDLQKLLKSLCLGGFAHHVAVSLDKIGDIVYEALFKYLDYNIEFH